MNREQKPRKARQLSLLFIQDSNKSVKTNSVARIAFSAGHEWLFHLVSINVSSIIFNCAIATICMHHIYSVKVFVAIFAHIYNDG